MLTYVLVLMAGAVFGASGVVYAIRHDVEFAAKVLAGNLWKD